MTDSAVKADASLTSWPCPGRGQKQTQNLIFLAWFSSYWLPVPSAGAFASSAFASDLSRLKWLYLVNASPVPSQLGTIFKGHHYAPQVKQIFMVPSSRQVLNRGLCEARRTLRGHSLSRGPDARNVPHRRRSLWPKCWCAAPIKTGRPWAGRAVLHYVPPKVEGPCRRAPTLPAPGVFVCGPRVRGVAFPITALLPFTLLVCAALSPHQPSNIQLCSWI